MDEFCVQPFKLFIFMLFVTLSHSLFVPSLRTWVTISGLIPGLAQPLN